MPDTDERPRSAGQNEGSSLIVRAAWIGAGGAVLAAGVGLLAHFWDSSTFSVSHTTAPVAIGSGAFAQGPNSTYISGSNNKIGAQDSEFRKNNGLQLTHSVSAVFAPKAGPKYQFMVAPAINHSSRRIDRAQILVFDASSSNGARPFVSSSEYSVEQSNAGGGHIPIAARPPENIRLCFTFESDQAGKFVTVTVAMRREADPEKADVFRYSSVSAYQAFYSAKHADCNRTAAIEDIPVDEYFASH